MNRLAVVIAAVLLLTALAFGIGLQRIYEPIFPVGKAEINGKDNGGKGGNATAAGNNEEDREDNQSGQASIQAAPSSTVNGSATNVGGTNTAANSSSSATSGVLGGAGNASGSVTSGPTQVIGGRGGGDAAPTAPTTVIAPPTMSDPGECLCETINGTTDTVQGVTAPLVPSF